MTSFLNIFWLGLKEIRSLLSDFVMVLFVVYAFTAAIYVQATGTSSEVNNASIAFVDEDESALSKELMNAFYPPRFQLPEIIDARGGRGGDGQRPVHVRGRHSAAVRARPPRRSQSRSPGEHRRDRHAAGRHRRDYIKNIINDRIASFLDAHGCDADSADQPGRAQNVQPERRSPSWFTSVVAIINQITLLTVVLTGAAVIREREHGTLEHLLVMPLTAFEIAMAKVWANGLVILVATGISLFLMVKTALQVPFAGSVAAVVLRRRALSVLHDGARDLPRDDFAVDGAVRAV